MYHRLVEQVTLLKIRLDDTYLCIRLSSFPGHSAGARKTIVEGERVGQPITFNESCHGSDNVLHNIGRSSNQQVITRRCSVDVHHVKGKYSTSEMTHRLVRM